MTTIVILVVTHIAAFVVGALVFRKNAAKVETAGAALESAVADVKKVV